jgi:predicted transcriptional regulator
MAVQTVTLSLSQEALDLLDRASHDLGADPGAIVSRALDEYLSLPQFSEEEVREGIREADSRQSSSLEVVLERAKTWNR